MSFEWNFNRQPTNPYLPANGSIAQMYANNMAGYKPLQTPVQKSPAQVAADASQNMFGYTRNGMENYRPNVIGNETVRGQQPALTPDLDGYGESLQQASQNAGLAKQREERIASLTSQIKELEDRIASNEAQLKGWTGPANEIAALEAEKINTADPTSIWRWKADKDESRRIAAAEKLKGIDQAQTNAMYEITNTLSAIRPNAAMDSGTQQRYFQQLADLKTLAQKNGLPTDAIDAKIREVEGGKPEGEEQTSREKAKTDWKGLKNKPGLTSAEVQAKLNDPNLNWDPDERKEAENLVIELGKKEAADQDVKDMKAWAKKTFGDEWDTLDPRVQAAYKRMWKAQKGKK
jgi:hypothetical protein